MIKNILILFSICTLVGCTKEISATNDQEGEISCKSGIVKDEVANQIKSKISGSISQNAWSVLVKEFRNHTLSSEKFNELMKEKDKFSREISKNYDVTLNNIEQGDSKDENNIHEILCSTDVQVNSGEETYSDRLQYVIALTNGVNLNVIMDEPEAYKNFLSSISQSALKQLVSAQ